ncbi:hypothetical protein [Undibacterium flavidum]|uniref:Uncharacterized protein n=1 Tax=Undibacterium flavidum TaxID=2762297 RepID=A0ABR6YEP3_9BURK|nr:hypothetical protein [Undibacterium flavidum]MBC3875034.1 hypothetical protein [Undibacterium flavidum]
MRCVFRLGVMVLVCLWSLNLFAQEKIQLERMVLTDSIDRQNRQFRNKLTSPIHGKKAYVWMQLRGSAALLELLRQSSQGSLPIRHEWYKYQSDEISAETPDTLNLSVDLSVGKKDVLQKLSYELAADGAFTWRVWSGKEQLSTGWWRVDLVYATGEPVLCPTVDNKQKACKFSFEVKR